MKTEEIIDGCENCKHNIPGIKEGLYCINNCINGSCFEPMTNVKHPRQHPTPSSTVYLGNDKTKWKSIEPQDPTCNKCTEFDFAHQIPEVNACPIHQPNKYKEQIENRRDWRSLINNFKPTPSSTEDLDTEAEEKYPFKKVREWNVINDSLYNNNQLIRRKSYIEGRKAYQQIELNELLRVLKNIIHECELHELIPSWSIIMEEAKVAIENATKNH